MFCVGMFTDGVLQPVILINSSGCINITGNISLPGYHRYASGFKWEGIICTDYICKQYCLASFFELLEWKLSRGAISVALVYGLWLYLLFHCVECGFIHCAIELKVWFYLVVGCGLPDCFIV